MGNSSSFNESNLTETLSIKLPWGTEELALNGAYSEEIEILSLQQNIIEKKESEKKELTNKLDIQSEVLSEAILEASKSDSKVNFLASKVADLQIELDAGGSVSSEELKVVRADLAQKEDLLIKSEMKASALSKNNMTVIESRDESERQLADSLFDLEDLKKNHGQLGTKYGSLKSGHELLSKQHVELKEKYQAQGTDLNHCRNEIGGIPKRIENAVATAIANHQVLSDQSSALTDANLVIQRLTTELREAKEKNISVNTRLQESESESARNKTVANDAIALVTDAVEKVRLTAEAAEESASIITRLKKDNIELMKKSVVLCNDNENLKRNNLYLSQILEYQELRTIYEDETGTKVYILSTCAALSAKTTGETDTPNNDYPLCMVINSNGSGHVAFLSGQGDDKRISFPADMPEKVLLPIESRAAVQEAMLAVPVAEFSRAVDESVLRAENITHFARLLDLNWSAAVEFMDFARELQKHGVPAAELERVQKKLFKRRRGTCPF